MGWGWLGDIARGAGRLAGKVGNFFASGGKAVAAAVGAALIALGLALDFAFDIAKVFVNFFHEIIVRLLSIPELIACMFGGCPQKGITLFIIILSGSAGQLVDENVAFDYLKETNKILNNEANVKIKNFGSNLVSVIKDPAPKSALNVKCGGGAFLEYFGSAGNFFQTARHSSGITIFIVNDVDGPEGCSLNILSNYVTIEAPSTHMIESPTHEYQMGRLIAHEVGHAGGLWHVDDESNLMDADGSGSDLDRYQKSVFRTSRHVTFW